MTDPGADVRVGIVSWNTAALLERCLLALPAALGRPADVVVVDNASADGSPARAAALRDRLAADGLRLVVVERPTNEGYGRAMDRALLGPVDGLAPATRALVALNPDTEAAPGSLGLLLDLLDGPGRIGLAAPRLVDEAGRLQGSVLAWPSPLVSVAVSLPRRLVPHRLAVRLALPGADPHDRPADVAWTIGAVHVLAVPAVRDVLVPTAHGDALYGAGSWHFAEDLDVCHRLHRAGWAVRFEPAAVVTHVGNAAGAQAWAEPERVERYLEATYDWMVRARGARAARRWAAANTLVVAVLTRRGRRPELVHQLALHRRRLRSPVGAPQAQAEAA